MECDYLHLIKNTLIAYILTKFYRQHPNYYILLCKDPQIFY